MMLELIKRSVSDVTEKNLGVGETLRELFVGGLACTPGVGNKFAKKKEVESNPG